MLAAYYVAVALAGVVVGSFVNVVIVRVPSDESIVRPRSKCPLCQHPIEPRDNIPIVSWLLLRGRCRHCGEPIHWGYPVVEALNGVLWLLAAVRFGPHLLVVPFCFLFSVLLAQSAIDIQIYRLPDRITFTAGAVTAVLLPVVALVHGDPAWIGTAAASAAGYFVFLLIPALIFPRGMGFGDVKLVALIGAYLGFITPTYVPVLAVLSVIISSLIGVAIGIGALAVRGGKSEPYPFGPWLALGAVVTVLFSSRLLGLYGF